MQKAALSVCLMAMAGWQASGQTTKAPAFDVASVRPSEMPMRGGRGAAALRRLNIQVTPDSLTMRNVTLRSAIAWAYHVLDYEVTGPDWLGNERFNIVAKSGGAVSEDDLRLMLQALLADRFKLAVHRQTKESPAYVLTVGKNGPKVHPSKTEGEMSIERGQDRQTVSVAGASLSDLIDILSNVLRAPVLDETGLKGRYDITVNIAKYVADGQSGMVLDPMSIIMTALQEELGLKLESRKTALDLVVVDHVEKAPTEN